MSLGGFTAPIWFLLLLVVAALLVGYGWMQHQRHRHMLRFANLAMLERVAPNSPGWRRHVPATLLFVALVLFTVALAGPTAEQKVPRNRATVLLVLDVSLSMQATDVTPSRFAAAKQSAMEFTDNLTPGINLGLVSFAGTPTVLVSPTTDRSSVKEAIVNLQLAEATATGEAIFAALQAIESFGSVVGDAAGPPPARIVLLSDGKQTIPSEDYSGPRGAFTAAVASADLHVPISTISFGTEQGVVDIKGNSVRVPAQDDAMREVARLSGGEFYDAESQQDLSNVYNDLAEQIGYETKKLDVSRPWWMAGMLLTVLTAASALLIGQRIP
ncbi:MAG TPA: VWA domain-containing protein [Pseudonocardiaceae bacterium]|jgi:Ca-activated chloride channel family protein|nr:VWA domain-containing protein [Pseudonocardiaceae bacterium]